MADTILVFNIEFAWGKFHVNIMRFTRFRDYAARQSSKYFSKNYQTRSNLDLSRSNTSIRFNSYKRVRRHKIVITRCCDLSLLTNKFMKLC